MKRAQAAGYPPQRRGVTTMCGDGGAIAAHLAGPNDTEGRQAGDRGPSERKSVRIFVCSKGELSGTARRGLRKSLGPMMFPAPAPIAQLVEQLTLNQ